MWTSVYSVQTLKYLDEPIPFQELSLENSKLSTQEWFKLKLNLKWLILYFCNSSSTMKKDKKTNQNLIAS